MRPSVEVLGRIGEFAADHRGAALGALGVGVVASLAQLESIAISAHGDASHRANGQSEGLQSFNDHMMWTLTTDAKSWSSAHVGNVEVEGRQEGLMHHGMTDANIYPATAIEQYLRTVESDPDKYAGFPTLPGDQTIPNLDPSAEFTRDEVREVGSFGIAVLKGILGEDYDPPKEYSLEEARAILDTSQPRYHYDAPNRKPDDEEYTQEEIAKILLCDPYSPVLEPTTDKIRNGAKGIDKHNIARFRRPVDFFRRHPKYLPSMLRDIESKAPKNTHGTPAMFGAAILGFTAYRIARKGLSIDSVLTGAVSGAAAAGIGVLGPIEGGKKVNGYGHDGRIGRMRDLVDAWRNKPVELKPDHNGTYMTKLADDSGWRKLVSRIADSIFAGELIGQPAHHFGPNERKYTREEGLEALKDNPPTTIIQALADRSLLGLRPGKGFDVKPGERRPDEVNSIVRMIQDVRVRTVYPEVWAERQAA